MPEVHLYSWKELQNHTWSEMHIYLKKADIKTSTLFRFWSLVFLHIAKDTGTEQQFTGTFP